jgi:hypothetical protein
MAIQMNNIPSLRADLPAPYLERPSVAARESGRWLMKEKTSRWEKNEAAQGQSHQLDPRCASPVTWEAAGEGEEEAAAGRPCCCCAQDGCIPSAAAVVVAPPESMASLSRDLSVLMHELPALFVVSEGYKSKSQPKINSQTFKLHSNCHWPCWAVSGPVLCLNREGSAPVRSGYKWSGYPSKSSCTAGCLTVETFE